MSISCLLQEIEKKRNLMMLAANQYGFSAKITITYSQELDRLIAEYAKYSEAVASPPKQPYSRSVVT
ncbi:aspartyl-phosphate phosphatase Spo0E family protein [Salisediminibacterium halotolerans]|uniref:aspartyl-phosphate phosphatase Spo0E family protein n=1 Tax=Salisediminibacterium halotolerans TaxID=517425 RepID=UPI000EB378A2|nr:aspartyl-phosphate phosphatase Spo0E family protein [Salisediminibacterium halotolerans]RLJ72347.1 Spo0E like sporulation regulatory protein [Actinophytocola xinjiangensis]RPE85561.1 Spo0E like sporulation regulatory protein [Salisediminibacterium halotolerans]TWG33516.1 Spo0E like sporulation regulatory protein [Salisediminibacterium halotolerans]GEL08527.1 hypothetical protein SHA02_19430 [Salisediminibacterium halotolerans]